MAAVACLLTFIDIAGDDDAAPDAPRLSVSARHEAMLADGRRVVLLDDRGWSEQFAVAWYHEPSPWERRPVELPDIWTCKTVEEMERTARDVVGPDEPFEGRTRADMEASHWESLARVLLQQGIEVDGAELRALRHHVKLSDRVLARIGASPATQSDDP
jgi:hypothetical protein